MPLMEWGDVPHIQATTLAGLARHREEGTNAVKEAEAIVAGRFRLFSAHEIQAGKFPVWHTNPLTGVSVRPEVHWSAVGDFLHGDIKLVWELSRFPWAFSLARAYARTRDARYAERFWDLFENWAEHNPPNHGPNWMCGQEASFRLFAVVFAVSVFSEWPGFDDRRRVLYHRFVNASAARIAANLDYAVSQSNNHGVSECVGVMTAELLLGPTHSPRYRKAARLLDAQVTELVYADGSFSQHSTVYHRVLIHDLLWCVAIHQASQVPLSEQVVSAAARAVRFLAHLTDSETGEAPLYGPNDGANILPLSESDFLDFRPAVQAGCGLLHHQRWLPEGDWDECTRWLRAMAGQNLPLAALPFTSESPIVFPDAGCFWWRRGALRLFFRCPTRFRHRPSQADLLHVDVAWHGRRMVHDAGTYSYNADGRFAGALKDARVHNTVTFDDLEPMQKAGRFLYLPWPKGRVVGANDGSSFEATHDGWEPHGIRHVRKIAASSPEAFEVTDTFQGSGRHRARFQWLLADHPFVRTENSVVLQTPDGDFALVWNSPPGAMVSVVRADAATDRGWWSPRYLEAAPALSLVIELYFEGMSTLRTRFAPAGHESD